MTTQERESCVKPAGGPIMDTSQPRLDPGNQRDIQEERKMIARVGKPAPDFEASAYVNGGFKNIKLSDFKGKWIVICFYPGDFTFV